MPVIYVERESQKGILIGKNGAMLKRIGTLARAGRGEKLLGARIFLQLWVKVKKDWREDERMLKERGDCGRRREVGRLQLRLSVSFEKGYVICLKPLHVTDARYGLRYQRTNNVLSIGLRCHCLFSTGINNMHELITGACRDDRRHGLPASFSSWPWRARSLPIRANW